MSLTAGLAWSRFVGHWNSLGHDGCLGGGTAPTWIMTSSVELFPMLYEASILDPPDVDRRMAKAFPVAG
jgi:hypothetical protein